MNPFFNLNSKKTYIEPTLILEQIATEENFALSAAQPLNDQSGATQQWDDLADIIEDVN